MEFQSSHHLEVQTLQNNCILRFPCRLLNNLMNSSISKALALLDSTLSTPRSLSLSLFMVVRKWFFISFNVEKLRSQAAVLTGRAMAILHNLNSSKRTSLNGSRNSVNSSKLILHSSRLLPLQDPLGLMELMLKIIQVYVEESPPKSCCFWDWMLESLSWYHNWFWNNASLAQHSQCRRWDRKQSYKNSPCHDHCFADHLWMWQWLHEEQS